MLCVLPSQHLQYHSENWNHRTQSMAPFRWWHLCESCECKLHTLITDSLEQRKPTFIHYRSKVCTRARRLLLQYIDGYSSLAAKLDASWNKWMLTMSTMVPFTSHLVRRNPFRDHLHWNEKFRTFDFPFFHRRHFLPLERNAVEIWPSPWSRPLQCFPCVCFCLRPHPIHVWENSISWCWLLIFR